MTIRILSVLASGGCLFVLMYRLDFSALDAVLASIGLVNLALAVMPSSDLSREDHRT